MRPESRTWDGPKCSCRSRAVIDERRHAVNCERRLWIEAIAEAEKRGAEQERARIRAEGPRRVIEATGGALVEDEGRFYTEAVLGESLPAVEPEREASDD